MLSWLPDEQQEAVRKMTAAERFEEDRKANRRYATLFLVLAVVCSCMTWFALRH